MQFSSGKQLGLNFQKPTSCTSVHGKKLATNSVWNVKLLVSILLIYDVKCQNNRSAIWFRSYPWQIHMKRHSFYRPQRSFSQACVKNSVHRGGVSHHALGQTSPGHTPPPEDNCSGWYASYWKAFLYYIINIWNKGQQKSPTFNNDFSL